MTSIRSKNATRVALLLAVSAATVAFVAARPPAFAAHDEVRITHIEVDKSERRLRAFAGERLVHEERAATGSGGAGQKRWEGDDVTPTGSFVVDSRHRSRRFRYFLHLNYPRPEDRLRYHGLLRAGQVPEGRGVGGDIGIHGESDRRAVRMLRNRVDWTAGCVAVSDETAAWLFRWVRPRATVTITD